MSSAAYRQANRQLLRDKQEAYRKANPERVARAKADHYRRNAQRLRDAHLLNERLRNGVVNATAARREGQCPVCLRHKKLVMDHDHDTGLIRGWLCSGCNKALGVMGDRLDAVQRLVDYLTQSDQSPPEPR